MFINIFAPFFGLIINASFQILSYKYIVRYKLLKSVYFGFLVGIAATFIAGRGALAVNLIMYLFLSYIYFHFINLGETGRRIRLLRELYDSREGLSLDETLARYNGQEILEKRLQRLVGNGQVILRVDRYYIGKPCMLLMARALSLLRSVLLGRGK